jgi:hypothetical protein
MPEQKSEISREESRTKWDSSPSVLTYEKLIENPTLKRKDCYTLLVAYGLEQTDRVNPQKDMRKKARDDIAYAVNRKHLFLEWPGDALDTKAFLRWAADKYPRFGEAFKVPRELTPAGFDASSVSANSKVRRIDYVPDDQLRDAYREKCREVFALEDQIEELKALNAEDRRDAELWRRQQRGWDSGTSAQNTES